ncbi:hypothetical protein [Streptomyces californicus]|uniref:hypothetical protein n=1 Tax=Streptomyces californicus TaxID=67351 RepID=UPI0036ACA2E5
MIETRKHFKREIAPGREVAIEVVFDNEKTSKTYVNVTDDTGPHEFLLAPLDLAALFELLAEANQAKYIHDLSY